MQATPMTTLSPKDESSPSEDIIEPEFRSVLVKLPYPGHLLRVESIEDMAGILHRAYVWQFVDDLGVTRTSAFSVQNGTYLTEMSPDDKE